MTDDGEVHLCAICGASAPPGVPHCATCARVLRAEQERVRPSVVIASRPAPVVDPQSARNAMALKIGAGVAVVAIAAGLVARSAVAPSAPPTQVSPVDTSPAPVQPRPPDQITEVMAKPTLGAAVAYARPYMTHAVNTSSPGTLLVTLWAIRMMVWKDVAVASDETTHAKIKKDADAEIGKRLCASGTIIEIAAVKDPHGPLYDGLLMTNAMNLFHFHAVGSTGDLVAQSPGRICGVVTGKFDYNNSAGGVGHAVDLVGMFDLPENRKQ